MVTRIVWLAVGVLAAANLGDSPAAHSSIEGIWNFSTLTPLERPAQFAGRATMTRAEAAQFERTVIEQSNADRRDGPAEVDVSRAYNEAWFDRGTHVAVVDGEPRTSLVVEPADGRVPPLTADAALRVQARARLDREHPADGPEDRSLAERCLSFNAGPPMLPALYNNYADILVFDRSVVILNEMIHDARVIPTDGRPHAAASMRRFLGDSIGRWDGRALIVDTTNFTDKTSIHGSGEQLHLIERFERTDANTLRYEFTVDDPASFTRRWRAVLPMQATTEPIYEYACHEGNEALAGILRGARFEERQSLPR